MRLYTIEFAELLVDYEDVLAPTKENFESAIPLRHKLHELIQEMDEEIEEKSASISIMQRMIHQLSYHENTGHEMGS